MKFELNKETLMKHRFWIVLGVAFCVILTGMLLASSDDMQKKRAEIEAALIKPVPTDKFQRVNSDRGAPERRQTRERSGIACLVLGVPGTRIHLHLAQ